MAISLGLLVLSIVACGSVSKTSQAATGNWTGAKSAVIAAYKSYKTTVNVSAYKLNYSTEYNELKKMMKEVVNETPYLYYAGTSYTVSRNSSTNEIVSIGLGYASDYVKSDGTVRKTKIKSMNTTLNKAINTALKQVDNNMSKVEKALVLHDYLVQNVSYNETSSNQSRLTEVGALVKKKANCQGYSLAYGILMDKVGIPVKYVSSESLSHMWNMVKISGSWYHVDVTWDDPVDSIKKTDQYGLVKHKNFLLSATKMKETGHTDFSAPDASNTRFDKKYWRSVNSAFVYRGGKWYYLGSKGIMEKTSVTSSGSNVVYNVTKADKFVKFNSSKFYFIAYNTIYLYNFKTNEAKAIWKASSYLSSGYALTQIKYTSNYVYYRALKDKTYVTGKFKVKTTGTKA